MRIHCVSGSGQCNTTSIDIAQDMLALDLLVFLAPLTMSPLCCLMRRCGFTVNLHAQQAPVN